MLKKGLEKLFESEKDDEDSVLFKKGLGKLFESEKDDEDGVVLKKGLGKLFEHSMKEIDLNEEEVKYLIESFEYLDDAIKDRSLLRMAIGSDITDVYIFNDVLYNQCEYILCVLRSKEHGIFCFSEIDLKQIERALEIIKTIAAVMLLNSNLSEGVSGVFEKNIELSNVIKDKILGVFWDDLDAIN